MEQKLLKLSLVFGVFTLLLPCSVMWYWGNISVYALSYLVCMHPSERSDVQTPWVISLFISMWILCIFGSSYVARLIRRRWLIPLTLLVADIAVFSTYFAIQYSLYTMILTFGLVLGSTTGILYGNALYLVVHSADGDVGMLISMVQGAFNFGGMIVSQIITWYVNPLNQVPTMEIGSTLYFTQNEVIDRVPSMFLVLGGFFLLTQFVGLSLLYFTPGITVYVWEKAEVMEKQRLINDHTVKEIRINSKEKENQEVKEESKSPVLEDYTPRQVLRKPVFYFLCFSFLLFEIPYLVISNFFKMYGQLWIHDDHFLTEIGTFMLLACFLSRLLCGGLIDKFGTTVCTIGTIACLVLVNCWIYFTPMVNRWLYFGAVLLFGGCTANLYVCFVSAITVLFGKKHVSTNAGMMLMPSVLLNLFAPALLESILRYGWLALFMASSWLTAVNLMLCVVFLPKI